MYACHASGLEVLQDTRCLGDPAALQVAAPARFASPHGHKSEGRWRSHCIRRLPVLCVGWYLIVCLTAAPTQECIM